MKVKELIKELSNYDPELEVRIEGTDPTDFACFNEVEDIYQFGFPQGTLDDNEIYDENIRQEVVVINGGLF